MSLRKAKGKRNAINSSYPKAYRFKYWDSRLFNDVYLEKDLPKQEEVWGHEEDLGFQYLMNELRNLATDYSEEDQEQSGWSELDTINNWIKRVLYALGWENKCERKQKPYVEQACLTHDGTKYTPDILIVDMPQEKKHIGNKKSTDKLLEARQSVLVPVEAKYWNRLEEYRQGRAEERKKINVKSDNLSKTRTPDQQIVQYMKILDKDWGILTDGACWRLFNKEVSGEDTNRYYEFDLASLVRCLATEETKTDTNAVTEAAKYFYFFFSKQAIAPEKGTPLVKKVLEYSKKYVNRVEEDLKDRFMKAMNIACNAFYGESKERCIDVIRKVAESALFNVLFIRSLESRSILPTKAPDYRKISLSAIIDKIENFDPDKDSEINTRNLKRDFSNSNGDSFSYLEEGTQLHDRIVRLTKIIHDGKSQKDDFGFEIEGFRESIFSSNEWSFFKSTKLQNSDWVNILFQLGYAKSDIVSRKYQQVPYSYFTPTQMGSIYESFLEFRLEKATQNMVFENKSWKRADLNSYRYRTSDLPKVRFGELFFTPDNRDRRITGSYYTPEHIVQYIVKSTLKDHIKNKSSKKILEVKVCDPAMGSGHFLLGSLNYLTEAFIETLYAEAEGDLTITHPEAKRKVLDSCIFGVDINPRAVKLTKMSLWLESAHINKKLECLDNQIKEGNSLIDRDFNWESEFRKTLESGGFDCIVQNPPYVFTRHNKIKTEDKLLFKKKYKWSEYQTNTYLLFMEKSRKLLKIGGAMGTITPNTWMTIGKCRFFREEYLSSFKKHLIINSRAKIFKDASVDCSITISKEANHRSKIVEIATQELEEVNRMPINMKNEKRIDNIGDPIISITEGVSISDKEFSVMEECPKLEDTAEVKWGIKAYQVGKGTPLQTERMKNERVYNSKTLKDSSYYPCVGKGDVRRFYLERPSKYVKYGKNLAEPRKKRLFQGTRVLVRQIVGKSPELIHAVVIHDDYITDCNSMIILTAEPEESYIIAALLNSQVISAWFDKKFGKSQRRTYPQFKVNELKIFPIPNLDISARKKIVELSREAHELHSKRKKGEVILIEKKIERNVRDAFFGKKRIKKSA